MPSKLNLPHLAARRRREVLLKATGGIAAAVCATFLLYQSRHICAAVHPSRSVLLDASSARGSEAQSLQERTPLYKPCARGCEQHGNCNFEEGRCECAWGYGGEDCSVVKLAACRQSTEPWAPIHTGQLPKACECYRQLWALSEELGPLVWDKRMPNPATSTCFERTTLAPEAQLSNFPSADEEVRYFRGFRPDSQVELQRNETLYWEKAHKEVRPLGDCPGNCTFRGGCVLPWPNAPAGMPPHCECYYGWQGEDCSEPWLTPKWGQYQCFNNCSDAGACRNGFCHCPPGRFGIACQRTEAWAPRAHRPDPQRFRIYAYELPLTLGHVQQLDFGQQHPGFEFFSAFFPIYSAPNQFFRQLLADPDVYTQDPYEASLFYVPSFSLRYTVEFFDPVPHMRKVIAYLREKHPFYDATAGRDHVWFLSRDKGGCAEWGPADDVATAIKIQHFCYRGEAEGGTFGWLGKCFDKRKDVCTSPYYDLALQEANKTYGGVAVPAANGSLATGSTAAAPAMTEQAIQQQSADLPLGNRSALFTFIGGIREETPWYSGGVRQELARLHKDAPGFVINPPGQYRFEDKMRDSIFCLAPSGLGWGIRLVQATAAGCIPVIIQDGIDQPHDDVVDFWKFALRVQQAAIKTLPSYLAGITPRKLAELQQGLIDHHRAFMWGPAPFDLDQGVEPSQHGLAYDYTIESLKRSYRNFLIDRDFVPKQ